MLQNSSCCILIICVCIFLSKGTISSSLRFRTCSVWRSELHLHASRSVLHWGRFYQWQECEDCCELWRWMCLHLEAQAQMLSVCQGEVTGCCRQLGVSWWHLSEHHLWRTQEGRSPLLRGNVIAVLHHQNLWNLFDDGQCFEVCRGLPVWLRDIPGIEFRTDNEPFKVCLQSCNTHSFQTSADFFTILDCRFIFVEILAAQIVA
jgi:hypothetical protein